MLCYDSVFGKVFEAEEQKVKLAIEELNLMLKSNGYLFLGTYFDAIEKLGLGLGEYRPLSNYLDSIGFKDQEDGFRLTCGVIGETPILVIVAPGL